MCLRLLPGKNLKYGDYDMLTFCLSSRMGIHSQFTRGRCSLSPKADRVDGLRANYLPQNTTSVLPAFKATRPPVYQKDDVIEEMSIPVPTPSETAARPGESFYDPSGCN